MPMKMRITETMRGLHHFVDPSLGDASDRSFYFRIDWSGEPYRVLNPVSTGFMRFDAEGIINVEGLTDGETLCEGHLSVDYVRDQTITYDLEFQAEGHTYRFVGQKVDVNLWHPFALIKTHTTCYGTTTRDDGCVVSRSVTHFVFNEVMPFVSSFRFIFV